MSNSADARALIDLLGERLGRPVAALEAVDWPALVALARHNRVAALAQAALAGRAEPPEAARRELLALARRSYVETTLTAQALKELAPLLAPIPWVLLRGPALGASLYGDLMLRPYGDLDVLVDPAQVSAALALLQSAGFRFPARALHSSYYRAFHLHLALARPGPAGRLSLELHWAIDHPFSLYTVDVAGILARRRCVLVEGASVPMPAPEDLLLTLALHTVKHAVQLPYWVETNQVERVVEAGHLLALLDIALALQAAPSQLDWKRLARQAQGWGAAGAGRACLEALAVLWPGSVPADERARFAARPVSRWQRAVYRRQSAGRSRLEQLQPGAFFRPVRLLDAWQYVFAPAEYLQRRYGSAGLSRRLRHTASAVGRLAAGAAALVYWSAGQALARARRASPPA